MIDLCLGRPGGVSLKMPWEARASRTDGGREKRTALRLVCWSTGDSWPHLRSSTTARGGGEVLEMMVASGAGPDKTVWRSNGQVPRGAGQIYVVVTRCRCSRACVRFGGLGKGSGNSSPKPRQEIYRRRSTARPGRLVVVHSEIQSKQWPSQVPLR